MILRDALPADVEVIHDFIRQLAAYENEPDAVRMTPAELREALFGPKKRAEAVLAVEAEEPLGFAIWFESFNTWTGKPGLYVEDVFVKPQARGQGIGAALFAYLAKLAVARGCQRLEWLVLDWNVSAIGFYKRLGAEALSDWTKYRLSGAALHEAAQWGVSGHG